MTLSITASRPTANDPSQVDLNVYGATGSIPVGSPIYTASFGSSGAGYDSWTSGTDSTPAAPSCTNSSSTACLPGYVNSTTQDWSSDQQYFQRTITGLTIGHVYLLTMEAKVWDPGPSSVLAYLGVTGIGDNSAAPTTLVKGVYTALTYTFTATATSHVVQMRRTTGTVAAFQIRSAVLQRYSSITSQPLSITRSDVNGKRFVRMLSTAVPDASGNLTVQDFESAYAGGTYRVIDAAGNVATVGLAPCDLTGAATVAQIVAVGTQQMATIERVTGLDQGYEYRESGNSLSILGRSGPVITTRSDNQWTKRKGTITYYASDKLAADWIVTVYKASRVIFLRTGGDEVDDLYHVASGIQVVPLQFQVPHGPYDLFNWTYAIEVDYSEINWPDGYLAGASWTYADVLAAELAYFDLPIDYATYAALTTG